MPKETIRQADDGRYVVQVGWWPDREVQVGVEEQAGFSLVTALYDATQFGTDVIKYLQERNLCEPLDFATSDDEADFMCQLGRELLNVLECTGSSPAGSYSGVWSTLDRRGVNRLIQILRKARDSAFGRDE